MYQFNEDWTSLRQHFEHAESELKVTKERLQKEEAENKALKFKLHQSQQKLKEVTKSENGLNAKLKQLKREKDNLQKYKEDSIKYRLKRMDKLSDVELQKLKDDINGGLKSITLFQSEDQTTSSSSSSVVTKTKTKKRRKRKKSGEAKEDKIKRLQEDINKIRKQKEKSMDHRLERIHDLDVDELSKLTRNLHSGLEVVQKERDTRSKCVSCMEKIKNVYFTDGCNHVVVCGDCEKGMENKVCPRCEQAYANSVRLDI